MSETVCENQLARETRQLMRKLTKGARLAADGKGGFALTGRGGRIAASSPRIAAKLVSALYARGLIVQAAAGGFVISDAGTGWQARADAAPTSGLDAFAAQHRVIETRLAARDGENVHVAVNLAESPLIMLHRRGLIDDHGLAAGERLRRDYTLAQMTPRMGVDWSAPCLSGRRAAKTETLSDSVIAAKQRFAAAMRAVGPELSGVLFDLCCAAHGLESCEKMRGWPRASAKVVLNIGLSKLARHYGIGSSLARAPMRGWVMETDRPPEGC